MISVARWRQFGHVITDSSVAVIFQSVFVLVTLSQVASTADTLLSLEASCSMDISNPRRLHHSRHHQLGCGKVGNYPIFRRTNNFDAAVGLAVHLHGFMASTLRLTLSSAMGLSTTIASFRMIRVLAVPRSTAMVKKLKSATNG